MYTTPKDMYSRTGTSARRFREGILCSHVCRTGLFRGVYPGPEEPSVLRTYTKVIIIRSPKKVGSLGSR